MYFKNLQNILTAKMWHSNTSKDIADWTLHVPECQNGKDQLSVAIAYVIVIIVLTSIYNVFIIWSYSFCKTKQVENITNEELRCNTNIASFERMPTQKIYQRLPKNVRRSREDAMALSLKSKYVWRCSKCYVYLLNRETALKHTKCTARSLPILLMNTLHTEENL